MRKSIEAKNLNLDLSLQKDVNIKNITIRGSTQDVS